MVTKSLGLGLSLRGWDEGTHWGADYKKGVPWCCDRAQNGGGDIRNNVALKTLWSHSALPLQLYKGALLTALVKKTQKSTVCLQVTFVKVPVSGQSL